MSQRLHVDTHVIVWLYAGEHDRFPDQVRSRLESDDLVYSPMVRLELAYLHEINRLRDPPAPIIDELTASVALREDSTPFGEVIARAESLTFSRDLFDRVILAQAITARELLVTKDGHLRDAAPGHTLWE